MEKYFYKKDKIKYYTLVAIHTIFILSIFDSKNISLRDSIIIVVIISLFFGLEYVRIFLKIRYNKKKDLMIRETEIAKDREKYIDRY